jgi:Uma2 family endonuclease
MERTGATVPDLFKLATRQRPLTVEEYHRMADAGILGEDDPVELLDGRLIAMSPTGSAHLVCVNRLTDLFARRLYADDEPTAFLSIQNPLRLSDTSEPEPDLVLLRPDAPQDRTPIPDDVLLVVEVADSSVDYDRSIKAPRYAAAGVPVFWLVDLGGEFVDASDTPDGDTYAHRQRYHRGDALPLPEGVNGGPIAVDSVMGTVDEE